MSDKKLLVPTDFSSVASCAVDHAAVTAEIIDADVCLLHIVSKKSQLEDAKKKLAVEAKRVSSQYDIDVLTFARVGSIFEDIGDVASELDAELIFMGTHGMKGMQFLTGSYAMKVITNSSVPFVIVQERPPQNKEDGFKNIIVPLDLAKETKQKLNICAGMSRYFDSKIHLIIPNETDAFLKSQLKSNLAFAAKYLNERSVDFVTVVGEEKRGDFIQELLKYSVENKADLISIMNLKENSLFGMIGKTYEQQIITNEFQVPVMVINPTDTSDHSGSVLFT